MDWTVYWFMLPVCVGIASVAMFSGISGAAMLMPLFLIGFPVLDVPPIGTVAAIGMSLFLETSGFGTGLYRYLRRGLVDTVAAQRLVVVSLPAGMLGAVIAQAAPTDALRLGYGVAMVGLAALLMREPSGHGAQKTIARGGGGPDRPCRDDEEQRVIETADGEVYRFCARGIGLQRVLSGGGGLVAGLISTGVGEATLPALVRRSGYPVPVAAATSTMVVAGTVAGAAVTHLVQLAIEGGFAAIPWNLLVWAVPGAVVGALVGTWLQGRVPERATRLFFSGLFLIIGVTFLLAFTVFRDTFS